MIKIGTSGYSFEDWKGPFYPQDIKPGDMLGFYSRYFNIVEINSTYYRIMPPNVFRRIVEKTPDNFELIVKANKATTHEGRDKEIYSQFIDSISPLVESGKFRGILAQFPWGFRNTRKNLDYILECRERTSDLPYFVEFRHRSWLTEDVEKVLREHGIGFVSVDEPQIGGMMPPVVKATTDKGYVRLHGRNASKWWQGGSERYDYLYTKEELEKWAEKIRDMSRNTEDVYVFFNNCHQGKAVKNALQMKEILQLL